jgi:ring-1,2-phenylacetyl-CoA epoxidase subunit PaaC
MPLALDSRLPTPDYLLHLADNALILGHRNSEWCGHGPILEQDIAITNISLDLIGQSRYLFQYAASIIGEDTTEDTLAYLRDVRDFKNCLLLELPKGDWAVTVLRQYLFSQFQILQYRALQLSEDKQLSAIAEKAIKEIAYHLRWSSEWVIRLGDGTDESNQRMKKAVDHLWSYTGELFVPSTYEMGCAEMNIGVDPASLKEEWYKSVQHVFAEATLDLPAMGWSHSGGKEGMHTEHLGLILAELQFMQRAYPGNEW